jgi:hypothetical protein
LDAEHVPQVTRAAQADGFQVGRKDNLAVEEVTRKNEPTEQCVQYFGVEATRGYRNELFASCLQVVEQVAVYPVSRIE